MNVVLRRHDSITFSHEQWSYVDFSYLFRAEIEEACDYTVDRLMAGTALLEDEDTIEDAGLEDEFTVNALIDLEGGKRKRKKKDYKGRPKKIKHKHKPRSKALLDYYNVETSGKVKKLKHECTKCEVGKSNHPLRVEDCVSKSLTRHLAVNSMQAPLDAASSVESQAPAYKAAPPSFKR